MRTHNSGNRVEVEVTLTDADGAPLALTSSRLQATFQGSSVRLSPLIPATDRTVEAENQGFGGAGRRYDRYNFVSNRLTQSGTYEFGLAVQTIEETIRGTARHEYRLGTVSRRRLQVSASETEDAYNGPQPDYFYQSGAGDLTLGSRAVAPGGFVEATVSSGQFIEWVGCCFADPTEIYVDGTKVPSAGGGLGGIYNWLGINPVPIATGPAQGVRVTSPGSHVIRFKLDPQFRGQYFTFIEPSDYPPLGAWKGPFINMSGWAVGSFWSETEGFVIRVHS